MLNSRETRFAAFYCEPGIEGAHEKGGVDGQVGYFRRNYLVPSRKFPVPEVESLAELNETQDGDEESGLPAVPQVTSLTLRRLAALPGKPGAGGSGSARAVARLPRVAALQKPGPEPPSHRYRSANEVACGTVSPDRVISGLVPVMPSGKRGSAVAVALSSKVTWTWLPPGGVRVMTW